MAGDAPHVDPAWEWIWRAWHRLNRGDRSYIQRGVALPLGATAIVAEPDFIGWTTVNRWAKAHGLSESEEELLDRCVQKLDEVLREDWRRRAEP